MKVKLLILIFSLSLLIGANAQAIGVGVKPKSLELKLITFITDEKEFLVINIDDTPAVYQVAVDDFASHLKVDQTDFQLQPGESKIVNLRAKFFSPGQYQTNISIVARPLGVGGLTTGSGVKLPVMVTVGGVSVWWGIVTLLLIFGFTTTFVVSFRKRKKDVNS